MSVVFRLESPYRGEYTLHRLSFGGTGPAAVAMVAGIHGSEVNGIQALNLVANVLRVARPRRPIHILPCVNTLGSEEARKRWPFDDRDINGAFPGDRAGAAVERIAAAVLDATEAELCIDVHSGSASVREHPHARAPVSGRELSLAHATGLPVVWRRLGERYEGGLVGAWRACGREALQVRGGRGLALDTSDATELARGIVRLLSHLGLVGPSEPPHAVLDTDQVRDMRSSSGGFFVPEVTTGDRVSQGTLLGVVRSPLGGEPIEDIRAIKAGMVLAVRVYPLVHAQELVVRVAEE